MKKKPLQALLIAGEKMRNDVLSNKKLISIRMGLRDYEVGRPIILCCPILGWCTERIVTSVSHKKLAEVNGREYKDDGFAVREQLVDCLRRFYPDINDDSDVTVIRWRPRD